MIKRMEILGQNAFNLLYIAVTLIVTTGIVAAFQPGNGWV